VTKEWLGEGLVAAGTLRGGVQRNDDSEEWVARGGVDEKWNGDSGRIGLRCSSGGSSTVFINVIGVNPRKVNDSSLRTAQKKY